jgi:hypothetical protein
MAIQAYPLGFELELLLEFLMATQEFPLGSVLVFLMATLEFL